MGVATACRSARAPAQVVPLQRGYIGVMNRGQADINSNKDIKAALKSEEEFLQNHEAYSRYHLMPSTPFKLQHPHLTIFLRIVALFCPPDKYRVDEPDRSRIVFCIVCCILLLTFCF